jgi:hypothetical protein
MVILVLITAMWMHTGLIMQTDIETLCEYMTDGSFENWDGDDCLEPSSCPYYCMCKRWTGSQWETLESGKDMKPFEIRTPVVLENGEVDQNNWTWVRSDRPAEERTDFFTKNNGDADDITRTTREVGWTIDEWIRREKYQKVFRITDPPAWPLSTMVSGKSLHVSEGVRIVEGHIAASDASEANLETRLAFEDFKRRAQILDEDNCMMEGLKLGRSVSFITAVMCEMLRAYTVRSTMPVYQVWNRNWIMHGACASSFLLTVSLTFIPGVQDLFKLGMPEWFFYGIAFIFALGSLLIDELSKMGYRRVLAQREVGDKGSAERKAIMDQLEMVNSKLADADAKNQDSAGAMNKIAELLEKDQGNKINLPI